MKATHFIGKHIDDSDIDKPMINGKITCKLCGGISNRGVTKMITDSFTDTAYFEHPQSDFLCFNCAKCLGKITTSEGKKTFFRNFSFLCTDNYIKIMKREDLFDVLLSPPTPPFILCVTFSNKKHMSFKASIQEDKKRYSATTDIGDNNVVYFFSNLYNKIRILLSIDKY